MSNIFKTKNIMPAGEVTGGRKATEDRTRNFTIYRIYLSHPAGSPDSAPLLTAGPPYDNIIIHKKGGMYA
jgi:hypothetical protein